MGNVVLNIINWFLGLATLISSLVIIYGGVRYFLARGNKEKEKKSIKMFIYGLVILFVLGFIYAMITPTRPPLVVYP